MNCHSREFVLSQACFLMIVIFGSVCFVASLDWYSEHMIDGVLDQIRHNKFTVTQAYSRPYNFTMWEVLNKTKIEVHTLDEFLARAESYGFYSISFECWKTPIIVWEPHYADTNPFYDIWFLSANAVIIYSYYPSRGTN